MELIRLIRSRARCTGTARNRPTKSPCRAWRRASRSSRQSTRPRRRKSTRLCRRPWASLVAVKAIPFKVKLNRIRPTVLSANKITRLGTISPRQTVQISILVIRPTASHRPNLYPDRLRVSKHTFCLVCIFVGKKCVKHWKQTWSILR